MNGRVFVGVDLCDELVVVLYLCVWDYVEYQCFGWFGGLCGEYGAIRWWGR